MLSINPFHLPCSTHKNEVTNVCLNPMCFSRVLCQECLPDHSSGHENFIISVEELITFDFNSEYKGITNQVTKHLAEREKQLKRLDEFMSKLTKKILDALQSIKDDITKQLVNDKIALRPFESLKEKFPEKYDKFLKTPEDPYDYSRSRQDFIELIAKFQQQKQEVDTYLSNISKFTLDDTDILKFSPKQVIIDNAGIHKMFSAGPQWAWDTLKKTAGISVISQGSEIIRDYNGHDNFDTVLGNKILSGGRHEWTLEIELAKNGIVAGVVPTDLKFEIEHFPYKRTVGTTGASSTDLGMQIFFEGNLNYNHQKPRFVLDFDAQSFEVWLGGELQAQGIIDSTKTYLPYFMFGSGLGKVKLDFK